MQLRYTFRRSQRGNKFPRLSKLSSFETFSLFLVVALLMSSIVATLPQTIMLMRGSRLTGQLETTGGFGFRFLREGIWFVIILFMMIVSVNKPAFGVIPRKPAIYVYLCTLWSLIVFVISFGYHQLPLLLTLTGLRTFQYVPLILLGYWLAIRRSHEILIYLALWLRYYVAVQTLVCIYQYLTNSGPSWMYTFLGPRVFGTFPYYNQFGAAMAVSGLCFLLASISHKQLFGQPRFLPWLYLTLLLCLMSGSRTGLIISCINVFYLTIQKFRKASDRVVVIYLIPLLLPILLFSVSNPEVTGRDVDLANEGRLDVWVEVFKQFNSIPDYVFGLGLGLGSNTSVTLFGEGSFEGQVGNTHNDFVQKLATFGLVGLILYLSFIVITLFKASKHHAPVFIFFVVMMGTSYSFWEFFPTNVLILFLWGCLAGIGRAERSG